MNSIQKLLKMKKNHQKISMVTCYDYWSAQLLSQTDIDCILVGDSVSMVVHGHPTTVHATVDMMALHTQAVSRSKIACPIVTDLPFLAHRKDKNTLMMAVDQLMKAGADALKIETSPGQEDIVHYLTDSGIPMVGHIGLTPQYVHQFGGYKVQGKDTEAAQRIFQQAVDLEKAGCHVMVLECVPNDLAQKITAELTIPTIGIGAGTHVDGQVLVLHDLLGFNIDFKPRFVRHFGQGDEFLKKAITDFNLATKDLSFPNSQESFT